MSNDTGMMTATSRALSECVVPDQFDIEMEWDGHTATGIEIDWINGAEFGRCGALIVRHGCNDATSWNRLGDGRAIRCACGSVIARVGRTITISSAIPFPSSS